jgi:hypothetical protein
LRFFRLAAGGNSVVLIVSKGFGESLAVDVPLEVKRAVAFEEVSGSMFHVALAFLWFLLRALICGNCANKASTKHTKSLNMLIYSIYKQTVNLLAYAFDGSNPSPTTTPLFGKILGFG